MKYLILFVLNCFSFFICNGQVQKFNNDSLIENHTPLDSIIFSAGAISDYAESKYFLFSDSALIEGPNLKIRSNEMKVYYFNKDHPPQRTLTEAHIYNIAYFILNSKPINLPNGYKKCVLNLSNLNYVFLFE